MYHKISLFKIDRLNAATVTALKVIEIIKFCVVYFSSCLQTKLTIDSSFGGRKTSISFEKKIQEVFSFSETSLNSLNVQ